MILVYSIRWIKKTDRHAELILLVFGHYYQLGVGCDIDKSKALALYLSVVNNNNVFSDVNEFCITVIK